MKERPILFNGEMVKALMDGRKTQTRRVMKKKHIDDCLTFHEECSGPEISGWNLCPYGVKGDRLWVRESFWGCDLPSWGDVPCVVYEDEFFGKSYSPKDERPYAPKFGHIPSIHMPRNCSRINLEVTDVRVERVKDIIAYDAGNEIGWDTAAVAYDGIGAKEGFQKLWDSINAKRGYGWDANPWVWVVSFKRIK